MSFLNPSNLRKKKFLILFSSIFSKSNVEGEKLASEKNWTNWIAIFLKNKNQITSFAPLSFISIQNLQKYLLFLLLKICRKKIVILFFTFLSFFVLVRYTHTLCRGSPLWVLLWENAKRPFYSDYSTLGTIIVHNKCHKAFSRQNIGDFPLLTKRNIFAAWLKNKYEITTVKQP